MFTRTWAITRKEFIQIFRDARTLAVVLVIPVLMLVLYGYAINTDVRHISTAVYDLDRSAASRELVAALQQSGYFDINYYLERIAEVDALLDRGKIKVAVVVPRGFSRDLAVARETQLEIAVDGSDSTTASAVIGYVDGIVGSYSGKVVLHAVERAGFAGLDMIPVDPRLRVWYNPELKSTNFIVPGLIAVILMMLSSLLTSMTVVRERERGTIEQLVVSPIMPYELMLGKIVPYVIIAYVDVVFVMAAGRLLFNVPMRGSPVLLLGTSGIFLFAALGLGLLISTVANSQQVAMTIAMLGTQLPSVLLSGFVFPIRSMPEPVQPFTNLIPAKHFLIIVRGIFLKGIGPEVIWRQAVALLVFGAIVIGLSSLRFKKRL